jgi:prepilin-type N-terminal cleavage/methylation domain-containing protein
MKFRFNKSGFSLIELSIVLIIMALLVGGGLYALKGFKKANNAAITKENIKTAYLSLQLYKQKSSKMPCPAKAGISSSDVNYGKADCSIVATGGVMQGSVPFKDLSIQTKYTIDSWGNKLNYVVSKDLTDGDLANDNDAAKLTIRNALNNSLLSDTITSLVFSSGPDGYGAYNQAGNLTRPCKTGVPEAENCNGNATFTDSMIINDNKQSSNYFNDIMEWDGKQRAAVEAGSAIITGGNTYNTIIVSGLQDPNKGCIQLGADSNAGFICGNKDGIAIGSTITKADAALNKVTLSVASSGTMQSALLVADSGILIGNPSGNTYPITCVTSEEGVMRYNSNAKKLEVCSGSNWGGVSPFMGSNVRETTVVGSTAEVCCSQTEGEQLMGCNGSRSDTLSDQCTEATCGMIGTLAFKKANGDQCCKTRIDVGSNTKATVQAFCLVQDPTKASTPAYRDHLTAGITEDSEDLTLQTLVEAIGCTVSASGCTFTGGGTGAATAPATYTSLSTLLNSLLDKVPTVCAATGEYATWSATASEFICSKFDMVQVVAQYPKTSGGASFSAVCPAGYHATGGSCSVSNISHYFKYTYDSFIGTNQYSCTYSSGDAAPLVTVNCIKSPSLNIASKVITAETLPSGAMPAGAYVGQQELPTCIADKTISWNGTAWVCTSMPSPVSYTNPPVCSGTNKSLQWDGSAWTCATVATNTAISPPVCTGSDKALQWDGTNWTCQTMTAHIPVCSVSTPYACTTKAQCNSIGYVWHSGTCVAACPAGYYNSSGACVAISCSTTYPSYCVNQSQCNAIGYVWYAGYCTASCPGGYTNYGGACMLTTQYNCQSAGGSWTGSSCSCPTYYNWNGANCVYDAAWYGCAASGGSWSGSTCNCPAGYAWNGSTCEYVPPSDSGFGGCVW